ncbi:MAG: TIGR02680 family protein, partial [Kribbellaceae bacterium]
AAERAAVLLSRREGRVARTADDLAGRLRALVGGLGEGDRAVRDAGIQATVALPAAAAADRLDDSAQADRLVDALGALGTDLETAGQAVSRRQAAVRVVTDAFDEHLMAERDCRYDEDRAADAERRWEAARTAHGEAEARAADAAEALWTRLRAWVSEPAAPAIALPDALNRELLENLNATARETVAGPLAARRAEQQTAASARDRALDELTALETRRAAVERESDPAPPEPALGRTERVGGAALWRLVDFVPDLAESDRAGLEAALQSSGLLDAWVRPDGAVLEADQRDTVLPLGQAVTGRTLRELLRPDCPPDGDVTAEVVEGVLSRVALVTVGADGTRGTDEPQDGTAVGVDGSWRLGPLRGRAAKPQAQYVGATARAAERERRLAEIDAAITRARARLDQAAATVIELDERITRLERWRDAAPAVQPVLTAWSAVEAKAETVEREHRAYEEAQETVLAARRLVARLLQEARRLAVQHGVPETLAALSALMERLRGVDRDLADLARTVPALREDVRRWGEERAELSLEAEGVATARAEAESARERANQVAGALAELEAAIGTGVAELQDRLRQLHAAVRDGGQRAAELERRSRELIERIGGLESEVRHAEAAVVELAEVRTVALAELGAIADVPGMVESVGDGRDASLDRAALGKAADVRADDAVPAALKGLAQELAGLSVGATGDENAVWRAFNDAANGPAADHEPRVSEFGSLLAVVGRDEGGECAIAQLATRVAVAVEQDRRLLTERERERFEQHILGELGDAIRSRRVEADELVAAMNRLLVDVTTSQGIRMKLDWRLRDDVPAEAREAIELLRQPVGALLPEERATLRDSLHRLIEASRAESPELSYGEHLAAALDYRRWFEFRIKYTRPEIDGKWLELHRRSPLSQGEQKVLCYLPLFAAAAAHFTSLAGAAPYAPRLVLLDDAFPKIDVRTHPLLFGLLVQLDLDFVITSERLWGDHDTVPSLAIYEALRDPSQRGIAQCEYRWDGRALRAVG